MDDNKKKDIPSGVLNSSPPGRLEWEEFTSA